MKHRGKETVLHEVQDSRHRIVTISPDGTNTSGEWVSVTEVAQHNKYFAIWGDSVLPQGVFTVRGVSHQLLS